MTKPSLTAQQIEAGLSQMQINARLTSIEAALKLMNTPGYTGIPGAKEGSGEPVWVKPPGSVDHITLLAIATDIEAYVIGDLVSDAQTAIENAQKSANKPHIMRP